MRPRLIAVDDGEGPGQGRCAQPASMRPRLIAVDDHRRPPRLDGLDGRFNEATAYCRG